jgi:hypothetical protein
MVIVNIVGSIGLCWLFVYIFVRYQTAKYNSALHQSKEPGHTVTAHIDDMQFAGLRLMETHQLMTFQLTVYPSLGDIYQTTIRQYMTQEALNNLQDIQYISFQEDPLSPGMGTILAKAPENKTRQLNINATGSDSESGSVKAVNYPHQIYNKAGKNTLLTLVGQSQNKISRILNTFLILVLFFTGFLVPFKMSGNLDWLRIKLKYYPQKFTFHYKGNFNEDAFNMAYDKAVGFIGDQKIESLLFYNDLISVNYEPADHKGYTQLVNIKGNTVEKIFSPSVIREPERLFNIDAVSLDRFKKAIAAIQQTNELHKVMYFGVRSDIWPRQPQAAIDLNVVFEDGRKSLHY